MYCLNTTHHVRCAVLLTRLRLVDHHYTASVGSCCVLHQPSARMVLSTCMEEDAMSRRTMLFAFGLITVLTGILALLDVRMAAIYGSVCVVFTILVIDLAERPLTVHERVRARRKVRQAAARRN